MRRTSPSGTAATAPATVPRIASFQVSSSARRRIRSKIEAGGMIKKSHLRMELTPAFNSLFASLNRRASSAREEA